MKRSFVNKKLFNVDVIDVKDLRMAADIMDFVPKFPMEVSGLAMHTATLTTSSEFSYPLDGQGMSETVFRTGYFNPDAEETEGLKRFNFLQMQNQGLYETFKEEGQVFFTGLTEKSLPFPLPLLM